MKKSVLPQAWLSILAVFLICPDSLAMTQPSLYSLLIHVTDTDEVADFADTLNEFNIGAIFFFDKAPKNTGRMEKQLNAAGHLVVGLKRLDAFTGKLLSSLHTDATISFSDDPPQTCDQKCVSDFWNKMEKLRRGIIMIDNTSSATLAAAEKIIKDMRMHKAKFARADFFPEIAEPLWNHGDVAGRTRHDQQLTPDSVVFNLPERQGLNKDDALQTKATWYRVHRAVDRKVGIDILSMYATPFGPKLSPKDWCVGAMEGTLQIERSDGQIITFNHGDLDKPLPGDDQIVDCSHERDYRHLSRKDQQKLGHARFIVSDYLFGKGERGPLIPYRTIAVEKKGPLLGKTLYIPAARGLRFKGIDGRTHHHDGYFFAADTGIGLYGNHIDIFIGNDDDGSNPFSRLTDAERPFVSYVVDDSKVTKLMQRIHEWES